MDIISIQIILIAVIVSISTSVLGVFLVLRKMSMMIDAISHTILFGIVMAYMVSGDLNSPWILIGATLVGLLTVILIELLVKTNRVDGDSATGIIFPLLFSIAIIVITSKYRNTHLDSHAVTGNLELAAFEPLIIFGVNMGSKTLYTSLGILLIVILFIVLFFKELKIIIFDRTLAYALGIMPAVIHYLLMGLISLTAVSAFNSVGVILVVAMMIGPAVSALLITKTLKKTIVVAAMIGTINAIIGYIVAMFILGGKVNIASTIATVTLLTFLMIWFFEPKKGLIRTIFKRKDQKKEFELIAFIFHIKTHENTKQEDLELNYQGIQKELNWSKEKVEVILYKAIKLNYVHVIQGVIRLTHTGYDFYQFKVSTYTQI